MSRSALTEFALANPLYVWVIVLTCLVGGLAGGQRIAQLEGGAHHMTSSSMDMYM